MPKGTQRPQRPPLRVLLHHLHRLRTTLHHHRATALRPRKHHHERVSAVRFLPKRVRGSSEQAVSCANRGMPNLRTQSVFDNKHGRTCPNQRPRALGRETAVGRQYSCSERLWRLPHCSFNPQRKTPASSSNDEA